MLKINVINNTIVRIIIPVAGLFIIIMLLSKTTDNTLNDNIEPENDKTMLEVTDNRSLYVTANTPDKTRYIDTVDSLFRLNLLELLRQYQDGIEQVSVQVSLLEIRNYILNLFPAIGQQLFVESIVEVFPQHADEILNTINKMDKYNRWLLENGKRLAAMSEIDNDRALWNKRIALFGKAAYKIWSGKLTAYEQRKQNVRDLLQHIEESDIISNEEKLHQLQTSLEDVYSYTIEGYAVNKSLTSDLYLNIESVQKELSQLPPQQRQQKINDIRRRIGYTEAQIEKMSARDSERNRRWDNGLSYMKKREQLIKNFSGTELDYRMDALREEHFQHEAKTIAMEEESGFYRYLRPRVIGRN